MFMSSRRFLFGTRMQEREEGTPGLIENPTQL